VGHLEAASACTLPLQESQLIYEDGRQVFGARRDDRQAIHILRRRVDTQSYSARPWRAWTRVQDQSFPTGRLRTWTRRADADCRYTMPPTSGMRWRGSIRLLSKTRRRETGLARGFSTRPGSSVSCRWALLNHLVSGARARPGESFPATAHHGMIKRRRQPTGTAEAQTTWRSSSTARAMVSTLPSRLESCFVMARADLVGAGVLAASASAASRRQL
jgi:hypothetical protein